MEIRKAHPTDLPIIASLARLTWRHCYPSIVDRGQIEYMLAQRYSPEAMLASVASGQLTYELLTVDGEPTAFAAHSPTPLPSEHKLQQLYVRPEWQDRGLGRQLIHHVSAIARAAAKPTLVLTVNRRNLQAIESYLRSGFVIRESADFDIGNGFVMEDYVMTRRLDVPPLSQPSPYPCES